MKKIIAATTASLLALAACAPVPNTSQTLIVRSLFNDRTIGGPQYPVVVSGAESVGLTSSTLAQSIRFPRGVPRNSNFRAVADSRNLNSYSRLNVVPEGNTATATLSFFQGQRRIGAGRFTMTRDAFSNPAAVGEVSSTMIRTMLLEARDEQIQRVRSDQ